MINLLLIFFL